MIRIYKNYQIKPNRECPTCYSVATDGKGGKVPDVLTGLFTSPAIAMTTIDIYLESKLKKEGKDAETRNAG